MARRPGAGRGLQKSDHDFDPRYRLPVHDVAGRLTSLAKSVSETETGGPTDLAEAAAGPGPAGPCPPVKTTDAPGFRGTAKKFIINWPFFFGLNHTKSQGI
jgi:hypothetical protein